MKRLNLILAAAAIVLTPPPHGPMSVTKSLSPICPAIKL